MNGLLNCWLFILTTVNLKVTCQDIWVCELHTGVILGVSINFQCLGLVGAIHLCDGFGAQLMWVSAGGTDEAVSPLSLPEHPPGGQVAEFFGEEAGAAQ